MANTGDIKSRKPWLAALSSLVQPGLGHLYGGELARGLLLLVCLLIVALLWIFVMLEVPLAPWNVVVLPVVFLLAFIYILADAARLASHKKNTYHLRAYNRWYVYVLVLVLFEFLVGPALRFTIKDVVTQAFKIPSGGMLPTILIGDHILVNKCAYQVRNPFTGTKLADVTAPRRGDVIVHRYPEDRERTFIKRVIGLPGETVEVRQGMAYVGGSALKEPYIRVEGAGDAPPAPNNFGPVTVPAGHLFVLGDNRNSSFDSRAWGFLPLEDVLGRAQRIYWHWGPGRPRVRWERIGLTIR